MNISKDHKSQPIIQPTTPRIAMLSTGEEVLFGDIVDTNASWLSSYLFDNGFQMTTRTTVGDSLTAISNGLSQLAKEHDVVIVNGGLGPTSDDMTAEAAALSAGVDLVLYEEWVVRIKQMFAQWQRPMPESNIKQAMLPSGSRLLDNPRGTACGFSCEINGAICYFTPGVPHEFKSMVNQEIVPDMQSRFDSVEQKQIHRIHTFGLSESGIASQIESLACPQGVTLGYRSALPFIEVKVFYSELTQQVSEFLANVEQELQANTISINMDVRDRTMALLKEQQLNLNIFDHSTQGYLHQWLAEQAISQQVTVNSINVAHKALKPVGEDEHLMFEQRYGLYSLERSSSNGIIILDTQSGGVQIALADQRNISSQIIEFKRDYSYRARSIVISAIAIDMLRRNLDDQELFADYGSVTRVASSIKKL
ncbi:CinA-like protein [Vibrio halioticoli NBRC 102217]|uniref:CinA-like protein n=1 Tax=Vibrio halioticoli NBRC 102217 TaxID=1219072 RepID=V5HH79_9VIBR|nr:molybdopterin-binding protein [Vibrio halioticoli]GAD88775.1 CinA-like protein [Vibrio halioticoli NBRC 102217]